MEQRQRISWFTGGAMIAVALFIDALEAMLSLLIIGFIANTFLQLVAWIVFYLWFQYHQVKMFEGGTRKAVLFFGGGALELIPFINTLPLWTLTTLATIFIVRRDDASYNKKMGHNPLPA